MRYCEIQYKEEGRSLAKLNVHVKNLDEYDSDQS